MSTSVTRHAAALGAVIRAPHWRRERLAAHQDRALRRIVRHAYLNVPYYRDAFDAARVPPDQIRSVADLAAVPVSTKAALVHAGSQSLLARGVTADNLIERRSSGSSGPMFITYKSRSEELVSALLRLRVMRYYGVRPTDKLVMAALDTRTLQAAGPLQRLAHRLGLFRTHQLLPVLPAEMLVQQLIALQPDVLIGLAGTLARAAGVVDDAARRALHLRHIVTGGEVLTPAMRTRIAGAFGVPVYDKYATSELGDIAYECRMSGAMHTCDDQLIVEVVRDGQPVAPGQRGEIVVTALNCYAMPMIRYRLADVATRGDSRCACGGPWGTIRALQGRMMDYLHLPSGRVMHLYEFAGVLMHEAAWVGEFQLLQESRHRMVAHIVPNFPPGEDAIPRMVAIATSYLNEDVALEIELVDQIEPGRTGKLRQCRSLVASEYDDIDWEAMSRTHIPGH